ncbi:uncharacterized protein LOC144887453 [Branchiostoma floridae x Branchiostoma japonicum]
MATGPGHDPDIQEFIRDNYVKLAEGLEVRRVIRYLIQYDVLTIEDKQRILHKETREDQAEEILDTLSRTGKCTTNLFINILREANQTALINSLKFVDANHQALQDERTTAVSNTLAAKLQVEYYQKGKNMQLDALSLVSNIFDPTMAEEHREQLKKTFEWWNAIIESIIGGCFIINLTFLQPCDVDSFYHDHFRVGPGSLSAALSDLLITDEMRAVVGGEELMVRVEVRYDDYIRVRRRLCSTGLTRSTSMDSLSAMLVPPKQTESRLLNSLDLIIASNQDSSFADWATDPNTKQLVLKMKKTSQTLKEMVTALEAKHKIARCRVDEQEDMVRYLEREVTRLKQEREKAQKVLLEYKKENKEVTMANREMEASIQELTTEKTKLTDRLATLEADYEIPKRQVELQEGMVRSLHREVTRLTQEQETAQKVQLDNKKEINDFTAANKGMGETIEELLAEKTKLTNKLAMVEREKWWNKKTEDKVYLIINPNQATTDNNYIHIMCVHNEDDPTDFFQAANMQRLPPFQQQLVMNKEEMIEARFDDREDVIADPRDVQDGIQFFFPPADCNRYSVGLILNPRTGLQRKKMYRGTVHFKRLSVSGNPVTDPRRRIPSATVFLCPNEENLEMGATGTGLDEPSITESKKESTTLKPISDVPGNIWEHGPNKSWVIT